MTDKRRKQPDPAEVALEAANQALAAANAAVQAAVKALALSRESPAEERARGGGSIRRAASAAKSAGARKTRPGEAPLARGTTRKTAPSPRPAQPRPAPPAPRPAAPKATPAEAAPSPAPKIAERPAATPPAPAPPSPAATDGKVFEAEVAESLVAPPPSENGVVEAPPPPPAPAPPAVEQEAQPRPAGAGPIILGPAASSVAPPQEEEAARVAQLAREAQAAIDAEDAARRQAELREREAQLAEREAAMARYTPLEPARAVPARPPAEPNGYKVLVVDDEEQVRALTVRILERFGYEVREAPGVEDAMAALDDVNSHFDLVLSDVAMPGLTGKDLFRKISETRPGLPVVFMSGYALNVYAPEGLIEEGVRLLPKPFTQEDLLGFVTEALNGAPA